MAAAVTAVTAVTAVWKTPFEGAAGGGAGARHVLLYNAQSGERGRGGSEDSGQKQRGRTERGQNNE
eukprot:SAG11_NODE_21_length_25065_cov_3.589081_14_plen_66_part_00